MQTTEKQPQAAPVKPPKPPKPVPPPEFQAAKVFELDQAALIGILKDPGATTFQKAKACQRLASAGTKDAVPALAALLTDPQLSHYGRYGLETIPDPAADDALRNALAKVKGKLLVGVINSIGQRRDAKAVASLDKLLDDRDGEVAHAAAAALGRIGDLQAAKVLRKQLARTKGDLRTAVARGSLVCAEELLARGERNEALAVYNTLVGPDIPKPVRLAAMHGVIATETSLSRPR